eukprot:4422165-Prorocentrum_lima.AAC.1
MADLAKQPPSASGMDSQVAGVRYRRLPELAEGLPGQGLQPARPEDNLRLRGGHAQPREPLQVF